MRDVNFTNFSLPTAHTCTVHTAHQGTTTQPGAPSEELPIGASSAHTPNTTCASKQTAFVLGIIYYALYGQLFLSAVHVCTKVHGLGDLI